MDRLRPASSRIFAPALGALLLLGGLGACENYLTDLPDDAMAPTVTGFEITPDSVNITLTDAAVTANLGVRGEVPVDSVTLTLETDGEHTVTCTTAAPTSGDAAIGNWSCTVPFPQSARSGLWTTAALELHPRVGSTVHFTAEELEEAGYPFEVLVAKVAEIVIDEPETTTLRELGDTLRLSATALDEDGEPMPHVAIAWSSADTAVVTIDLDGLVTAIAEGETTITAAGEGLEASIALSVDLSPEEPEDPEDPEDPVEPKDPEEPEDPEDPEDPTVGPVDFIIVLPSETTLAAAGDTVRLAATAYDSLEIVIESAEFAWDTDDESVALVDETGLVTAMGPGTATITATFEDVTGTAVVTVEHEALDYWTGWVAVGRSDAQEMSAAISADGVNWELARLPFGRSTSGGAVATDGERWLAVGGGLFSTATVVSSVDGRSWTPGEHLLSRGNAIVWHDGLWVMGGQPSVDGGPTIGVSTDGDTWEVVETPQEWIMDLATNGKLWVAVGRGSDGDAIATSTDARSWTPRFTGLVQANAVAWNGELWVVGGQRSAGHEYRGTIMTSPDGVNWTERDVPINEIVYDIAWNGGTWIAVGRSTFDQPSRQIAVSADGIEWTSVEGPFGTSADALGWNGRYWVAGGGFSPNLAISGDGLEWTAVNAPLSSGVNGIAWGGARPVNLAPRARIVSPTPEAVASHGKVVEFEAEVGDAEDGTLGGSAIHWTSDLDGELGTGATLTRSNLTVGTHTVTLTVTDSDGAITKRSTTLVVEEAPRPEIMFAGMMVDTYDLAWLGGDALDGPPAVFHYLVSEPASAAPDTFDATITGPSGQTFTCDFVGPLPREELSDIVPVPMDAEPWGCAFVFGAPVDLMGSSPPDPEELAAVLDTIELGTWRVTEIRMREAGVWHVFDAAALAGFDLGVEVVYTEPEPESIGWITIQPRVPILHALGDTLTLTAAAIGHFEQVIPGVSFTWTSLDPQIVTVDADGVLTAQGFGTGRVTAEARGVAETVEVHVLEITPPIAWDTVVAGSGYYGHSCGLANGVAYCWGNNQYGQLGVGPDTEFALVPTPVAGGHTFTAISVGEEFTVALTASGKAYAWGRNNNGQLGDGTTEDRYQPVMVAGGHSFSAISAGDSHVLALTTDGHLHAWGTNQYGQLGMGSTGGTYLNPVAITDAMNNVHIFDAVSAGGQHSAALKDGVIHTWGRSHHGQIGDGFAITRPAPVAIKVEAETFVSISAGQYHNVARTSDGRAFAWGFGTYGQIGNGTNQNTGRPTLIPGYTFETIVAEGNSTFGIDTGGVAYAWGSNFWGELGIGSEGAINTPHPIAGGFTFRAISGGGDHTMGLTTDGTALGWGSNSFGQLGDGTLDQRLTPTPVVGPRP